MDYSIALDSVGDQHATLTNFADPEAARSTDIMAGLSGRSLLCSADSPLDFVDGVSIAIGTTHSFAWRLKQIFDQHPNIILFGDSTATGCIFFFNGSLNYRDSAGTTVSVSYSFSGTDWHHFAISRSGATVKFYVDGVQIGTDQTIAGSVGWTMTNIVGPVWSIGSSSGQSGLIDDARLYLAQGLSEAQFLEIASGDEATEATGATRSHHWTFNEGV